MMVILFVFFFQAEDGIRDADVTGVQTCALPIFQLDVLMVREEGGTWAQTAMTVPDPGSELLAHALLPDPFSERAPRPKGAYLHWALPDALTGGSGTAHGGDVSFPPIPDRWLVVRLSTPQPGARRAVTAWV